MARMAAFLKDCRATRVDQVSQQYRLFHCLKSISPGAPARPRARGQERACLYGQLLGQFAGFRKFVTRVMPRVTFFVFRVTRVPLRSTGLALYVTLRRYA
jgi:hypothetical protein